MHLASLLRQVTFADVLLELRHAHINSKFFQGCCANGFRSGVAQGFRRAAGGDQLHAQRGKLAREFDEAGFVGDGEKGALDHAVVILSWRGDSEYYVLTSYPECR